MTGTFGGALEARGIKASEDHLSADVHGEVEKDDGVMVIRRIRVTYRLKADSEQRETIERVHRMHADKCPVYRTLRGCIDITTELVVEG
ncbi:MAG: OsmC family protein [Gemmatimonadota bacterium]|nr:OsmC family protein [Gemmatimonadota bacterium]